MNLIVTEQELVERFGSNGRRLSRALGAFEIKASEVVGVSGDPPLGPIPRTFQVVAQDGEAGKVRLADRVADIRQANGLVTAFDDPRVPGLVATSGRATLERWWEGTVLSQTADDAVPAELMAELMADLHEHVSDGRRGPILRSPAPYLALVLEQLGALAEVAAITSSQARATTAVLRKGLTGRARWAVIHADLCPQNFVQIGSGDIVSIDNERFREHFTAGDLARSWQTWGDGQDSFERFHTAYRKRIAPDEDCPDDRVWRLATLVRTLFVRVRRGAPMDRAIDRFGQLLETF